MNELLLEGILTTLFILSLFAMCAVFGALAYMACDPQKKNKKWKKYVNVFWEDYIKRNGTIISFEELDKEILQYTKQLYSKGKIKEQDQMDFYYFTVDEIGLV